MTKKIVISIIIVSILVLLTIVSQQNNSFAQVNSTYWSVQFGTAQDESANAVASDSNGDVYVVGESEGNLYATNLGGKDIFIVKYNSSGVLLWNKQLGTALSDYCTEVVIDKLDNVYIGGSTSGNLFGTNAGGADAFLAKYDPSGALLWSKQFGTSSDDGIGGLTVDANNNIYATGSTDGSLYSANTGPNYDGMPATDAFLAKFDSNGNLLWGTQYGADNKDFATAVTTDASGNAYVVGDTYAGTNKQLFRSVLGSSNAYVAKYSPTGTLLWGQDIGSTGANSAYCVCADAIGNVYVGGNLNAGDTDFPSQGYIAKFDANGNSLWMNQNTLNADESGTIVTGINLSPQGNIVAYGYTDGSVFGPNLGSKDIILASYDTSGNLLWSQQSGTSSYDESSGINVDNLGNIYIVGYTQGNLFNTNAGGNDAFIQKLSPTGQMASAKLHRPSPYKPLLFAWSGQRIALTYPSVLANKLPYVYAGYLCSGIPGAKVIRTASKQMVIEGRGKQIVISPNSLTYQINGKAHKMAAKPVMVNNECYVPLDVMKALLPYPVHYDAKAQTVHFDPPQKKVARR